MIYTGRVLEKEVTYVLKTRDIKFWSKRRYEEIWLPDYLPQIDFPTCLVPMS